MKPEFTFRKLLPSSEILQNLKERYARGDIGQDEFEQKKRNISDAV